MISHLSMLRHFALALQFLTVFKIRVVSLGGLREVGESAWAFPVVGGLLGAILVVAHLILSPHFPPAVTGILVVGLWVVLTGGLHLDGWTDCWDSLPASVPPERRRQILKDSRLGTFGALALILLLALKFATVARPGLSLVSLFAAPAVGRAIMVVASYGVRDRGDGMAALFLSGLDYRATVWAGILGVCAALIAGWSGIFAAVVAYLIAASFRRLARSRLEMVNGDVIGAMCELSETVFLVMAAAQW